MLRCIGPIAAWPFAAAIAAITMACAGAAEVSDSDMLAIMRKHCVMCHARSPVHESFDRPPKGVTLESIVDVKRHAAKVREQVEDRSMPLGDQSGMTDAERDAIGRWVGALK
jgi:uncharacterized membrane protein